MREVIQLIDAPELESPVERISEFLTNNFTFANTPHPDYPSEILGLLRERPDRLHNSQYVDFYLRIMQIAAEYGFPSASAHLTRRLPRDPMHPLTLLALGGYLSDITLQATAQRETAEMYWNERRISEGKKITGDESRKIWSTWVSPAMGRVDLPAPEDFLQSEKLLPWEAPQGTRLDHGLPLYQPDSEFHYNLREVAPNMKDVESMQRGDFDGGLLDVARTFYRYDINVFPVFNNPREWSQ